MADLDLRACWVAGLWAGVPQRILRERTEPLKDPQIVRRAVEAALASAPYLEDAARETLALVEAKSRR